MRLNDLWIRYGRGGPWVLRAVDAGLAAGEIVVVQGRNGAGKSTLLNVVAGIRPAARGSISDRPAVVGWVPERFPAAQPFTALTYLLSMAGICGMAPRAARAAVDELAQRLHLTDFLGTRLIELSKGSAQKVGLAQALLVRPGLLVLDEPWEGLDAQTRAQIPAIMGEVTAAGGMVLVSDHRGEAVKSPHTARWLIEDGQLSTVEAQPDRVEKRCVIEISVAESAAEAVAAKLRGDGHEVLAVRS